MKVAHGKTRVVLLLGGRAYKLARIRPLRFLGRMCVYPFSQKAREHFATKYGNPFIVAAFRDVFAGIIANRTEFQKYVSETDPRLMPVLSIWLGGLVSVQVRGNSIASTELPSSLAMHARQFARDAQHHIVLVDYGARNDGYLLDLLSAAR